MLKWLRSIDWTAIVGSGLVLAFGLLVLVPAAEQPQQKPHPSAQQEPYNNDPWWERASFWEALFTGLIAIYAIRQFAESHRAGNDQMKLTRESIELARDEFNATHRAEIIIHSMEHAHDKGDIAANVMFFNTGSTPAKDVIISGKITTIAGRPLPGIMFPELHRIPGTIIPGKPVEFGVTSNISIGVTQIKIEAPRTFVGMKKTPEGIYCIGEISYSDAGGVSRHTGFCWKWDTREGRHRWVRQSRSSYEYAY